MLFTYLVLIMMKRRDIALTIRTIIAEAEVEAAEAAVVVEEVAEVEAAAAAAARIPTPTALSNVTMMMPTACCAQVFAPAQTIVTRRYVAQMCQSAVTTVPMVLMNTVQHVTVAMVDSRPHMKFGVEMHGSRAIARPTVVVGTRQCSGVLVRGCAL